MSTKRKAKLFRSNYDSIQSSENWDDLLSMYTFNKRAEGVSEGSIRNRENAVKLFQTFLQQYGLDLKPHEVTQNHVRQFIHYLRHEHVKFENNHCVKSEFKTVGLSDSTIRTHIKLLRAMFNHFIDEQILTKNPFNKVKLVSEPIDTVDAPTTEEVQKILRVPDQRTFAGFRNYVLLNLLVDSGVRISEAINLKQHDIDFKTQIIEVRAENSKNKKARYVPISRKTTRLLKELIAEVKEFGTPFIFVTVYGNQIDRGRFRNQVKEYAKKAGITRTISVHMFRHYFIKEFLLNGGSIMSVQKIVGHSSLAMLRRYTQLNTDDIRNQHSQFSPLNKIR